LPFGYEKYGDNKCHCRPGFSFINDGDGNCYCINSKKATSSSYYATHPQGNGIYGLSDAKIGDECYTDTDCGQIKVNSNWYVDYLSNLRCDYPSYNIYSPPVEGKDPKGKCFDISTYT
jgi:hypothetical protein